SGKVYTADKLRSKTGNTIVAGEDNEVTPLIGSGTKVIDLGGKLVLPGFIDTYVHPIIGGIERSEVQPRRRQAHYRNTEARSPVMPGQGARRGRQVVRGGAARQLRLLGDSQGPRRASRSKGRSLSGEMTVTQCGSTDLASLLGVTAGTPDPPGQDSP